MCVSSPASPEGVREQITFHDGQRLPGAEAADRPRRAGRDAARACGRRRRAVRARGRGTLAHGGDEHALERETGIYIAPGERYELVAEGGDPLEVLVVEVPEPAGDASSGERA